MDYKQVDDYTLLWVAMGVLGLKVVQDMVEDHQGMAYFVEGIEEGVDDKLVLVVAEDIQDCLGNLAEEEAVELEEADLLQHWVLLLVLVYKLYHFDFC